MIRKAPFLALLLLQACAPSGPQEEARGTDETAAQAGAVVLDEEGGALNYHYSWPAEAVAIPALHAQLQADAEALKHEALTAAQHDQEGRAEAGFPFHPHELTKSWKVEGEGKRLLAFRGEFYEFTGGAHGLSGFQAILWDKANNRAIEALDLFADKPQATALLEQAFCPALNAERAERRGGAVPPPSGPDDWMNGCPALAEQVLIPGAVRDGAFTALHVLIGPYTAGPYAEGTYEIALPLTPALVGLVRPEYAQEVAAGQ